MGVREKIWRGKRVGMGHYGRGIGMSHNSHGVSRESDVLVEWLPVEVELNPEKERGSEEENGWIVEWLEVVRGGAVGTHRDKENCQSSLITS